MRVNIYIQKHIVGEPKAFTSFQIDYSADWDVIPSIGDEFEYNGIYMEVSKRVFKRGTSNCWVDIYLR